MAYNKKTWKARQGLGLNKFSIDGATPVPVVNQPDSVTQQGDALSAGNLNDLEQRIADAFDDVEESKDALQSQINQHESRLENLEQKAGDYTTVQYRGTNAVPTGKAKNGLVEKIVGKSRAWNQLYTKRTTGSYTEKGISFTFNDDGSITVGGSSPQTATGLIIMQASPTFDSYGNNHKLLLFGCPQGGSANGFYLGALNSGNGRFDEKDTGSGTIISVGGTYGLKYLIINIESGTTINSQITFKPILRDLIPIFPEGVPSTIAECVQKCPDLLKYDAYNISLVDETLSGAKSKGVNIWDEVWEIGNINNKTSALEPTNNAIRATNYTKVKPNSVIRIYCGSGNKIGLFAYDENKNFIGVYVNGNFVVGSNAYTDLGNHSVTLPLNCHYIKIKFGSSYGTTYKNDTQISVVNGSVSTINTTYHPHKTDTLSLSETVTLRSAGSVADTDELNVEVLVDGQKVNKRRQTTRVGSIVLDGSADENYSSYSSSYDGFPIDINGMSIDAINPSTQLVSDVFIANTVRGNSGSGLLLKTWTSTDSVVAIFLCGTGETTVAGLRTWLASHVTTINFNLATPVVTLLDPIIENFLEVEGGGTVETIQTQTPVIDNCLDVGYLTV